MYTLPNTVISATGMYHSGSAATNRSCELLAAPKVSRVKAQKSAIASSDLRQKMRAAIPAYVRKRSKPMATMYVA